MEEQLLLLVDKNKKSYRVFFSNYCVLAMTRSALINIIIFSSFLTKRDT